MTEIFATRRRSAIRGEQAWVRCSQECFITRIVEEPKSRVGETGNEGASKVDGDLVRIVRAQGGSAPAGGIGEAREAVGPKVTDHIAGVIDGELERIKGQNLLKRSIGLVAPDAVANELCRHI